MIDISHTETIGWEHAIRGMRNPMNSWDKSDSFECPDGACYHTCPFFVGGHCNGRHRPGEFIIGDHDLSLMKQLSKAGTDHRKFMRMIVVYCDITAPMYWWKEFDTYKVGTVRNSTSTMHKIHSKEFTLDDFSCDDFYLGGGTRLNLKDMFIDIISDCEYLREKFVETKDKKYWKGLIQLLPSSYNQKSTVMLNYEVLANMYHSRKNHKLDCWKEFCKWIEGLPYSELITEE